MNRRTFIKACFLSGIVLSLPKTTSANDVVNKGLTFPFMFQKKQQHTNEVSISEFKADNIFQQLWQDILRFIK